MVAPTCTLESVAALKLLAHAVKFPANSVNGVLLGALTDSNDSQSVLVRDTLPLCHTSLTLAPALETGLAMAEAVAQQPSAPGQLVGYYVSDARMHNAPSDLGPVHKRVAERLLEHQLTCVVLTLDTPRLKDFIKGADAPCPFDLYSRDASRGWRQAPQSGGAVQLAGSTWKQLREELSSMLQNSSHRALHDWEEHLDDINKDFTNSSWAKQLKFQLPGNQPAAASTS